MGLYEVQLSVYLLGFGKGGHVSLHIGAIM